MACAPQGASATGTGVARERPSHRGRQCRPPKQTIVSTRRRSHRQQTAPEAPGLAPPGATAQKRPGDTKCVRASGPSLPRRRCRAQRPVDPWRIRRVWCVWGEADISLAWAPVGATPGTGPGATTSSAAEAVVALRGRHPATSGSSRRLACGASAIVGLLTAELSRRLHSASSISSPCTVRYQPDADCAVRPRAAGMRTTLCQTRRPSSWKRWDAARAVVGSTVHQSVWER